MSIYRNPHAPTSDVHATPLKNAKASPNPESEWEYYTDGDAARAAPVSPNLLAMRKPQPANVLLNHTIQWANKLPQDVRPQTLMREFPRVANMVALLWGEPTRKGFDEYIESLLVDRRGTRKGFPPAVVMDLLNLRSAFDQRRRR